jgi:ectoine hydroxylase-related dioxygenase (phytanoyl-CoA dioxygenase family)
MTTASAPTTCSGTELHRSSLAREVGVFEAPGFDGLIPFFSEHGFAIVRGLYSEDELRELEVELERQQARLVAGDLPEQCGTVILDDPDAVIDGEPFAHYVCHVTEVSTITRTATYHPTLVDLTAQLLGPQAWLLEDDRFGVVYQDARPGDESGYSRIGWHSDAQSGPTLHVWPSVAFTIHIDATSPRNGFLRVVPGSHLGGTADMPPGFEHVAGEMAVYCERGDVLLHHSDLWHSAARATDDGEGAVRRHVRGGWYGGERLAPNHGVGDFVKNARR